MKVLGLGRIAGATVAALALSSCGTAGLSGSVVPWSTLTASPTMTTTTTTTTLVRAAPCRSSQMETRLGRGSVGLGNELTVVVFTNTGPLCRLSGYPNLEGQTATHQWRPLRVRKNGTYFGGLNGTDLATGQSGLLFLGTSATCNALNSPSQARNHANERAFTYDTIRVLVPHDGGSAGVNGAHLDVACGLDESQLGVRPPTPGTVEPRPGSVASLTATASLPTTIRAGTTLSYVVTLHNPTTTEVTFTPCPNFTEAIFIAPNVTGAKPRVRNFALNCAQAVPVAPHGSERFAMELVIPPSTQASLAKFAWSLDTGSGPYIGRAEEVEPSRASNS
ncbi:MAG: DUF4232 domain-containing protein [Acidimicrobiales bacterium]